MCTYVISLLLVPTLSRRDAYNLKAIIEIDDGGEESSPVAQGNVRKLYKWFPPLAKRRIITFPLRSS